ncbi:hypothetical protein [Bradyrhizobium sp. BR 10289]|uniref:hypothetical protein n=1 Tax=Bradyrhizobium sp. BR 10289 TaxID=2749993 RepID=UPI001C651547|nr:hypothetical protein [Bradyrhizobium sp. BR 10289]MBW7974598.1 hypothetical protein [Bradyrhizobium sp. BR 10289]
METAEDVELVPLNSAQTEQFARIEQLWPEFGHSLQVLAASDGGGMAWRTVDGIEYLTRYTREDGKQKVKSLGRRTPETEAIFAQFESTVLKARRVRRELREDVLLSCKLAKAYGVARLHGRLAETLDRLWYTGASSRVSLFGGSALLAYESGSGILAPAALVKDRHLQFVARTEDLETLNLAEIAEACDVDNEGASYKYDEDRYLIRTKRERRTLAEVFLPTYFVRRLDGDAHRELRAMLRGPGTKGLTFSRDTRPIELTALDPAAYAIASHCMRDDELWAHRAEFACSLVRHCWPDTFDVVQEAILDVDPEVRWLRLRGP